ncbi:MAG: urease accessory protein UreE [Shimia sp.]
MSADLLRASSVTEDASEAVDTVALDYAGRLLRRKRLVGQGGLVFLLDLPRTTHVNPGEGFQLEDGRVVAIAAEEEPLLRITGDLPRLAWHIGNRHTPCQIVSDHLLIQRDKVLADMLGVLGASVEEITGPFTPEGGAYGHGRTMGHSHDHDHDHDHAQGHSHSHE